MHKGSDSIRFANQISKVLTKTKKSVGFNLQVVAYSIKEPICPTPIWQAAVGFQTGCRAAKKVCLKELL